MDVGGQRAYIGNMAYTPLALANTFVARHGTGANLDQMKLHKLDFYAYGWWLAYHPDRLLVEGPEVWRYGPVFSSLYSALRPYGGSAIESPVGGPNAHPPMVPETDKHTIEWVDWVWGRYGHLSALQLSDMTHEIGSPWQLEAAAKNYRVPNHHKIPDSVIREYFKGLAANLA
jgi:uncharacterized phage-associated protein